MGKKPYIKKFKVNNNYYIYDVNTNNFFAVEPLVYELIDNAPGARDAGDRAEAAKEKIEAYKDQGYFSSHRPKVSLLQQYADNNFIAYLKDFHQDRVVGLALVVTENCNLRCRYCAYSGNYAFRRSHGAKTMSAATMKQAVDFYFAHSSGIPDEKKFISFYGGEPMLNLDLVKECVSYVKEKLKEKLKEKHKTDNISYGITINGTLLNREAMQFLVENRFRVQFSIDGPRHVHDRNRQSINGEGSFSKVMEAMKSFKKSYPEYYRDNVSINAVLTAPLEVEALNEFFADPEISTLGVRFTRVSEGFTDGSGVHGKAKIKAYEKQKQAVLDSFNNKVTRGEERNLVEGMMFISRYLYIHRRDMFTLPGTVPALGPCVPGGRSVMVNVDGSLNFCTQVDDVISLGNADRGYDYDVIEKLFNDMDRALSKQCYGCWAIRLCSKCVKDVTVDGKVDQSHLQKFCRLQRKKILHEIKDYIAIREVNPDALDYLDELEPE